MLSAFAAVRLTVALVLAVGAGVGWLVQPVTVPLGGLMALTFVPTSSLIEMIQAGARAASRRAGPPDGQR